MKRFSKLLSLKSRIRKSKSDSEDSFVRKELYNDVWECNMNMRFTDSSIPLLPIEIWQEIIELACSLPMTLSVSCPDLFNTGSTYICPSKEQEAKHWRVTRTLQLVCRSWRAMALRRAYRRVVLCCEEHMKLLVRTLEESKRNDPEGIGYGRWVHEIETRRTACSPFSTEDETLDEVKLRQDLYTFAVYTVRTFRCTPNLQVYINKNGWAKPLGLNTYRAVMIELGKHCGSSLLRLQWTASESPRWDDLKNLLCRTPNLRTLAILYVDFEQTNGDGGNLGVPPERTSLPHLEQLHLGPFPRPYGAQIPYWDPLFEYLLPPRNIGDLPHTTPPGPPNVPASPPPLASLRTLSITPLNLLSKHTPSDRFFHAYGKQLEDLATSDVTPEELRVQSGYETSNRTLSTILDACPTLHSLIFEPLQYSSFRLRPLAHPRVERVALFPATESVVDAPERISRLLRDPLGMTFTELSGGAFPRLRVLRLRDRGELECLGMSNSREWFADWQRRFEKEGIRFENGEGLRFTLTLEDSMEDMPDGL